MKTAMILLRRHETPAKPTAQRAAALLVLIASMLRVVSGSAQPAPASVDELVGTLATIEAEAQDGGQSAALLDPLKALATRYEEDGNDELALATIDRALDITRINYGLHSLEQVPLLKQAITIEEERGNHAVAWELEGEMIALAERHPDDLATVPVLREIADQRMELIDEYVAGEFPPAIILGCYYRSASVAFGSCSAGSKGTAVRHILEEATRFYDGAISTLVGHGLYSSDEVRELEMKLIRANYFHGSELYPPARYEEGKRRFHRLMEYDAEISDTRGQIEALVWIGDWDLMYSKNAEALDTYMRAYAWLVEEGIARESIDALFAPDTPIVLPAFLPNPLVSEETSNSTGFIDVSFEITRFGRSRQIDILDSAPDVTRRERNELAELIAHSRFRPRTRDGEFDDTTVVLRYHLND